ncbi:MAG: head-tail connector protein [Pseudomonadota bacterium]
MTVVTPPDAEPLALADVKAHLRIEHSVEDALIQSYIASARAAAEGYLRGPLMSQTVRLTYDAFPPWIRPPVWPVQSVESIAYDDAAGVEQIWPPGRTRVVDGKPLTITPAYGDTWPATRPQPGAVRLTLRVGYAAVPADILAALRLMTGDFERWRADTSGGAAVSIPRGVAALLRPHAVHF